MSRGKASLPVLQFPSIQIYTLQAEAKNLSKMQGALQGLRNLQRDRLAALAKTMVERAKLDKELEIGEVTECEDGFKVEFRFRG
jgi:hypothetical protein